MAEMSELYGESANETKIEEHLEESLINQDDYKKLKQENENYRQELYILRLKLNASDAVKRDLEESNEAWEKKFVQYVTTVDVMRKEAVEKYIADKEGYENHIADLEASIAKSKQEIKRLQEELQKYKDLLNERPCQVAVEETLILYEQNVDKLTTLLHTEQKSVKELKSKLANLEDQNQELSNKYHVKQAMDCIY